MRQYERRIRRKNERVQKIPKKGEEGKKNEDARCLGYNTVSFSSKVKENSF
jgi:hypothetical protein